MEPAAPSRLLTADAVSAEFAVSKKLIYALVRAGELPAVRTGRLLRFDPAAVAAFVRRGGGPIAKRRRAK